MTIPSGFAGPVMVDTKWISPHVRYRTRTVRHGSGPYGFLSPLRPRVASPDNLPCLGMGACSNVVSPGDAVRHRLRPGRGVVHGLPGCRSATREGAAGAVAGYGRACPRPAGPDLGPTCWDHACVLTRCPHSAPRLGSWGYRAESGNRWRWRSWAWTACPRPSTGRCSPTRTPTWTRWR